MTDPVTDPATDPASPSTGPPDEVDAVHRIREPGLRATEGRPETTLGEFGYARTEQWLYASTVWVHPDRRQAGVSALLRSALHELVGERSVHWDRVAPAAEPIVQAFEADHPDTTFTRKQA